jgi:hypothetical protein
MVSNSHNFYARLASKLIVPLVLLAVNLGAISLVRADDCEHYDCEKEPKRVALVIGNVNYAHLEHLPSAAADVDRVSSLLTLLGFDVEVHRDVQTPFEFWNQILPVFRQKLTTGDFIVFYFSGHGFSHGADSFVAPTELPLLMTVQNVTDHAIAVESVKATFETHSPGLILFIIDACRSPGALKITDIHSGNDENLVQKGPAAGQNLNPASLVNTIIAYATEPGHAALGTSLEGQPSPFTGALAEHLLAEGSPFSAVFKDAAADLTISTNPAQIPGTFDWSRTDPYLRPTAQILAGEKEAWVSALTGGRRRVSVFVQRFSVSRFLTAGRKWLAENPPTNLASGFTRASPIAIDRAWRSTTADMVAIRRLSVSLAFARSYSENDQQGLRAVSDVEIGLVRSGISPNELAELKTGGKFIESISPHNELRRDFFRNSLAYSLSSIDTHGIVVATHALLGRAQPEPSARIIASIPAQSVLKIIDVTVAADESTWVHAVGGGSVEPFYFKLEVGATPQALELGHSVKEILVPARHGGIQELVDPGVIKAAIADLKLQGWKITWISLATGATADEFEQDTRDARMANAEYILKHSDIPVFTSKGSNSDIGDRITSVSGRQDLAGGEVRIRFFGIK